MTLNGITDNNESMKKILLLILLFSLAACKDDGSSPNPPEDTTTTPVVTIPDTPDTPTEPTIPTTPTTPTWTEEFVDLVNNHRRNLGLRELATTSELDAIAIQHSVDMAKGVVPVGHTGMDQRCDDGRDILGGGNWCGENVADGQKTPKEAFTWWINSSAHRGNIELARYTHMAFGYAKGSNGRYYWTQVFWEH